jgi:regulatory protein
MAGKISRLQVQQRNPDRVNVYVEDEYVLALPALEAAKLHIGDELSDDDLVRLRAVDANQKAVDRALRFISYRPRSREEVRRNLTEGGVEPDVIETVLGRLERQGYIDDDAFARYWVENRERFKPRGAGALRYELRQKGVESDVIASVLEDLDAAEGAYRAAQPRAQRLSALATSDIRTFRQKLAEFLMRRGFSYSVVRSAVGRLEAELTGGQRMTEDD